MHKYKNNYDKYIGSEVQICFIVMQRISWKVSFASNKEIKLTKVAGCLDV